MLYGAASKQVCLSAIVPIPLSRPSTKVVASIISILSRPQDTYRLQGLTTWLLPNNVLQSLTTWLLPKVLQGLWLLPNVLQGLWLLPNVLQGLTLANGYSAHIKLCGQVFS